MDDELVVLIRDVPGAVVEQVTQVHEVVVCQTRSDALRYGLWHTAGRDSVDLSAILWPRYLDAITLVDSDTLGLLTSELPPI